MPDFIAIVLFAALAACPWVFIAKQVRRRPNIARVIAWNKLHTIGAGAAAAGLVAALLLRRAGADDITACALAFCIPALAVNVYIVAAIRNSRRS